MGQRQRCPCRRRAEKTQNTPHPHHHPKYHGASTVRQREHCKNSYVREPAGYLPDVVKGADIGTPSTTYARGACASLFVAEVVRQKSSRCSCPQLLGDDNLGPLPLAAVSQRGMECGVILRDSNSHADLALGKVAETLAAVPPHVLQYGVVHPRPEYVWPSKHCCASRLLGNKTFSVFIKLPVQAPSTPVRQRQTHPVTWTISR